MANLSINQIILGGRLTADVELRKTPQGTSVASFSIATKRKGKDAQTDFINCVAWNQTADFVSQYFGKGSSICVRGSLQQRGFTDKNNEKRYVYEVIVDEVYFVDSKSNVDAPSIQTQPSVKFEEVADDDTLPF